MTIITILSVTFTLFFFSKQLINALLHMDLLRFEFRKRLMFGVVYGVCGILIMFFGVPVSDHGIIDFRYFFIIIAAYYGGLHASILAAVLIAGGRALLFGGLNEASITAGAFILLLGVLSGIIFAYKRFEGYWAKWSVSLLVLMALLYGNSWFTYGLEWSSSLYKFLFPPMLASGLIVAYCVRYLTQRDELFQQKDQEATTDFLTQLANVRAFDAAFNRLFIQAESGKEPLALLFLDIDYFKKINDTYGHPAGDAVLRELAAIVRRTIRAEDVASRYGGEEFSILLPNCSPSGAYALAENLRSTIQKCQIVVNDKQSVGVTVSIGIACYPEVGQEFLIDYADQALYQAKLSGRNKTILWRS
ncbi:diguanylate cyclase [Paenibacillus sp. FSL H8-0537]|uniref:GGDEF domain-containing protein n=1 Tax=Paenibacillus sp. FSL H8-0537 TaxID=2921399 RepID=UPI003100D13F